MQCTQCKKPVDVEWDVGFIWITPDGDLVCSDACLKAYEKEKQYFYEVILPNDNLFQKWMGC